MGTNGQKTPILRAFRNNPICPLICSFGDKMSQNPYFKGILKGDKFVPWIVPWIVFRGQMRNLI